MRRILLVLWVAVLMAALVLAISATAFAGSTQSGQFGSGNTGATGSPTTANCQGAGESQFVSAGNSTGNPGSNANPSLQFGTFNGPFTSSAARDMNPAVPNTEPGVGDFNGRNNTGNCA